MRCEPHPGQPGARGQVGGGRPGRRGSRRRSADPPVRRARQQRRVLHRPDPHRRVAPAGRRAPRTAARLGRSTDESAIPSIRRSTSVRSSRRRRGPGPRRRSPGRSERGRACSSAAGARRELDRGWYLEPTVLADVGNAMAAARDEIFAPVLSVIECGSDAEAVEIANDSPYGLSGAVFSADPGEGAGRLPAGEVGHAQHQRLHDQHRRPAGRVQAVGGRAGVRGVGTARVRRAQDHQLARRRRRAWAGSPVGREGR